MPDKSSILAVAAASLLVLSGIPRTADGKPDLSGLWRTDNSADAELGKAMDALKPQPWAAALAKKRKEELFKDSPGVLCLPPGPVVDLGVGKMVQTPNRPLGGRQPGSPKQRLQRPDVA